LSRGRFAQFLHGLREVEAFARAQLLDPAKRQMRVERSFFLGVTKFRETFVQFVLQR
jgi:hypothetical protein